MTIIELCDFGGCWVVKFMEETAPGLVLALLSDGVQFTTTAISLTWLEGGCITNGKESRTAAVHS